LTVENISIDVKTNAGSAANQFRSLSSALRGVSGTAGRSGGIFGGIGKSAQQATKHTNQFVSSLKRIAMYRVLRTIIKEIGQAFSEGLKNAYNYSKSISGTLASAMDMLSTKTLTMKNQMGAALGGLLTAITPILLRIIELCRAAAQALSALFSALGGGQYLVAKDVATSWDKATGAAQKYKNTILGFDEINRLNDESGGGGGGIDTAGMFEVGQLPEWAQTISDKFKELKDSLDFTNLKESWDKLKESAGNLADTLMTGLGWAWDNILVPLAQWTISSLAPKLVDLLAAAFNFLNAVLQVLAPIFEPFWENVLKPFFEQVGGIVIGGLDELIDLLTKLTNLVNGNITWDEFISGLSGIQAVLLLLGGVGVLNAVSKFLGAVATIPIGIKNSISGAAQEVAKGNKLVSSIKQVALGAFDAVMIAYDVVKLKEASDTYVAAQEAHNNEIETALSAYAQLYEDKGKEAADQWAAMVYEIDTTNMSFEEAQAAIAAKIETYWEDVPQNMWEGFKQGWDYYFGENGVGLWQLFKDAFEGVLTWLRDLLGIHSPSTVFEDIGTNIVQGLIDGFNAQWDIFLAGAQELWDGFKTWVAGWSLPSPTLPHIKLTYDEYDPSSGLGRALKKFLNITQIPKFNVEWYAEGGVHDLSMGSLFVAGEAGAEIVTNMGNGRTGVTNVEQMKEAVREGNLELLSAVQGGINVLVRAINDIDPDITIDGQSLADKLRPYTDALANRRGSNLVTIGGTV